MTQKELLDLDHALRLAAGVSAEDRDVAAAIIEYVKAHGWGLTAERTDALLREAKLRLSPAPKRCACGGRDPACTAPPSPSTPAPVTGDRFPPLHLTEDEEVCIACGKPWPCEHAAVKDHLFAAAPSPEEDPDSVHWTTQQPTRKP